MIHIEDMVSGERRRLEHGFYVRRQDNGKVVRCHRVKAQGVCDGERIWSLGSLEGYPEARIITTAEYLEALGPGDGDAISGWEQPENTNGYGIGDKVRHNAKVWVSIAENNMWEPGVYGWEEAS